MSRDDTTPTQLSYEQFGRRFFEIAVTENRIGAAFTPLAGEDFEIGPLATGPGGMVKVKANVSVGRPVITRYVNELITFKVRLPLSINLVVDLRLDRLRYDVTGVVPLDLTVRAVDPLSIHIDVDTPRPRDVQVGVASHGTRAEVIRFVAQVDDEIKRVIAKHVSQQVGTPEIRQACIIDIAHELDKVMPA
ncbi:MAG: hypothetical protein WAV90_16815 [Gordonia amarae]